LRSWALLLQPEAAAPAAPAVPAGQAGRAARQAPRQARLHHNSSRLCMKLSNPLWTLSSRLERACDRNDKQSASSRLAGARDQNWPAGFVISTGGSPRPELASDACHLDWKVLATGIGNGACHLDWR